ncbi:MAG: P-loop NTPase fold protein [Bacteroidota bacterium]
MKLEKIYSRPIDRRINPVAVVSELNDALVDQEISEYVFTTQIYDFLYTVINNVVAEKDKRTGVWINGYYGSGKSHFLKYIFYAFSENHKKSAIDHFKETLRAENSDVSLSLNVTNAKLNELSKKLDSTLIDSIMFNIDAVSGDISNKEAITKIFLSQLNLSQGYNGSYIALAKLEKQLDKAGKFDEFKQAIKEKLKEDWNSKSADLAEAFLNDVLQIAKGLIGIDESSFRASIERAIGGNEELSVVDLVGDLLEFLADKPDNFRLVFLIDEVSWIRRLN